MGSYAAPVDLDRHLGRFRKDLTEDSRPRLDELPDFIREVEDELDLVLLAHGATTVPIDTPDTLLRWLKDTIAIEASSRILGTLLPMANGTLSTTRQAELHALYLERMKRIEGAGSIADIVITTGTHHALPRSFHTSNPIDDETSEEWAPAFGIHTKW